MNEMVERVTRAIERAEIGYEIRLVRLLDGVATHELRLEGGAPLEFESHGDALRHVAGLRMQMRARAAIEAMREPTQEMDLAAVKAEQYRSLGLLKTRRIWTAMIDAALEPEAPK